MRTLYGLGYSGWTEKARWALEHHRVDYRYREHTPLIGEPLLRWRTPRGVHPSVPMLTDEAGATTGSFNIAKRAESLGQGAPLFPSTASESISHWETLSDGVLGVARANVVQRLLHHRKAQEETLPGFLPGWLRSLMAPSAKLGARYIARKHRAHADADAAIQQIAVPALEQLRAALNGRPYLVDGFTYADINAAVMLQFVQPVDDRYLPLGPGTREIWTQSELAGRFPDLIEWRDGIYAKHRRP